MASFIPSESDNLRIVLLGNVGVGKSATANVILRIETFRETETTECEIQRGRVDGRNISVIDTPGINSSTLSSEQLKTEMRRCLSLSHPGPHAFLLVIRVGNFTGDSRNSVKWVKENFGEEALKFTMVLFTGKEDLTNSQWSKFIEETNVQDFTKIFGGGYYVINSKREINPTHLTKLLEKIEEMVKQNKGQFDTDKIYDVIQKRKAEEPNRRLEIEKPKQHQDRDIQEERRRGKQDGDSSQQDKIGQKQDRDMHKLEWKTKDDDHTRRDHDMTQENMFKTMKEEIMRIMEEQNKSQPPTESKTVDDRESKTVEDEVGKRQVRKDEPFKFPTKAIRENEKLKHDLQRQEESRRERERRKWEHERAKEGGSDSVSDLRIVLLGRPGSGKSSTGNTILGREAFGEDLINVPGAATVCKRQDGTVGNKSVTVIDTKGNIQMFNKNPSDLSPSEFEQCLQLCSPGPHVFLLVRSMFSSAYDSHFPQGILKHSIFLFTHQDKWVRDDGINTLVKHVNNHEKRFHVFNNEEQEDRTQVTQLLEKIEELVQRNGGIFYTNEMYQEAKRKRIKEQITSSGCSVL